MHVTFTKAFTSVTEVSNSPFKIFRSSGGNVSQPTLSKHRWLSPAAGNTYIGPIKTIYSAVAMQYRNEYFNYYSVVHNTIVT